MNRAENLARMILEREALDIRIESESKFLADEMKFRSSQIVEIDGRKGRLYQTDPEDFAFAWEDECPASE